MAPLYRGTYRWTELDFPGGLAVQAEYTIDELARVADTTVRSVRVYHERGLLPSPELRGRIGYYGSEHLARLQTISRLLSRGMKLNGIRELLEAWDRGDGLAEVLGVPVQSPTHAAHTRPDADPPRNTAAAAHDADTIALYRPATPRCADLTAHLVGTGLGPAEAHALVERLRADCDRIAERHAAALLDHNARLHDSSACTADDHAGFESTVETTYFTLVRAVTELLEQSFARHAGLS